MSSPLPQRQAPGLPITAALLSLASSLIWLLVLRVMLRSNAALWRVLMRWDAAWWGRIAAHGYGKPGTSRGKNLAFFPLYPLLEHVGHVVTGMSIESVAVGSSVLLQAAAAALLVLIARGHDVSDRKTLLWVTLFLVSPPVVFDIMGYYSALLCVLCFLALWLAQRGRLWLVVLVLGLASATSPIGIAFSGGFVAWSLILLVSGRSVTWRSLLVLCGRALVSISGVVGYSLYLLVRFGEPLAFYQEERAWSAPVPVATTLTRIVTFGPMRGSISLWAALPFGPHRSYLIDTVAAFVVVR